MPNTEADHFNKEYRLGAMRVLELVHTTFNILLTDLPHVRTRRMKPLRNGGYFTAT